MLVQSSRFRLLFPPIQKRIPSSLSFSVASSAMDSASPSMLFLCGKSSTESEIAKSLKINDTLNLPNGGKVSALLQSEINTFRFGEDAFNVDLFLNSLTTKRFGRFLIWSPLLPSTHDIVSHNFCELPVGTVCVADTQFKGRGRSKNAWESPRGCLMFSFTLQMEDGKTVPLVQYVVSLAVTEAIKDVCDRNGFPFIDVRIKWPNDLYLNGLKVGGILCTSTYKSKKFNVSSVSKMYLYWPRYFCYALSPMKAFQLASFSNMQSSCFIRGFTTDLLNPNLQSRIGYCLCFLFVQFMCIMKLTN
ncbi:biotin--protein ligase 1, chloroplastic isoform X2 [Gossypium raimondii]|uniref:biotin--protein ligase 1, chloroplastic isoform X2 n=1 Tax=Gossypium raimondii TaxID=29730 RepID=UPI00227CD8AF|nr:biotin--protein ligase 1, chloroplastic isoform X2 [Gossypium raimondii]